MAKVYITDYIKKPDIEKKILGNNVSIKFDKKAEVLLVWHKEIDSDFLKQFRNLKGVVRYGVGFDNIDIKTLKKRKKILCTTPHYGVDEVSDTALAMLLSISRGLDIYDKSVKEGNFSNRRSLPLSKELYNKNILIVGFGRVGKNLIKKCISFDMKIFVYDPFVDAKTINDLGGKKIDNLNDTIKEMDYITIHAPLTEKTRNLINKMILNSMKESSIIINTSRGGIINEIDLDNALNKGLIFGAGLDVFEKEPPDINNPLLKNKKVFLSPHSSTFTEECNERMSQETIQNIIDFFENKLHKDKIVKL